MDKKLLQEVKTYYTQIKSIYDKTEYNKSYRLNEFWAKGNMQDMLNIINSSNSAEEAICAIQKTWLFSVNTSESIKEKAVDWLLAEQNKRGIDIFNFDSSIEESKFSNPDNNVLRKGRILTPDFLRVINITCEINKYCKINKSKPNIIELGAGCGHLARVLRIFIPNCSYVIIDIPETLCFSYMFLKLNFPDAKTIYVTEESQLNGHSFESADYIFIPTKFKDVVLNNQFDLFINTASLGEMKNAVIRSWMDFVQKKLQVKYLFTLNRYLNTIKTNGTNNWRLDENECSVSYDAGWKIMNWEIEPSFTRCPYGDTIISRYLEIVAEKISPLSLMERKVKSQQLLKDITDEDWVRLDSSFPSQMTYRDNILVNDLTMNGTLFKIWESLRLYPNETNTGLMLKYLETLLHCQDKEFEEAYYYEELFENIFVSKDKKELLKISNVIKEKRQWRRSCLQVRPSYIESNTNNLPILMEASYKNFNIVFYQGKYFAISQELGPIDLIKVEGGKLSEYVKVGKCFIGKSSDEVKFFMEEYCKNNLQKKFEEKQKELLDLNKAIKGLNQNIEKLNKTIASLKSKKCQKAPRK